MCQLLLVPSPLLRPLHDVCVLLRMTCASIAPAQHDLQLLLHETATRWGHCMCRVVQQCLCRAARLILHCARSRMRRALTSNKCQLPLVGRLLTNMGPLLLLLLLLLGPAACSALLAHGLRKQKLLMPTSSLPQALVCAGCAGRRTTLLQLQVNCQQRQQQPADACHLPPPQWGYAQLMLHCVHGRMRSSPSLLASNVCHQQLTTATLLLLLQVLVCAACAGASLLAADGLPAAAAAAC